jgi:hypothetical protein
MGRLGFPRLIFHWMPGFSHALMQERPTQTALLPHFSLALVGFLDIQSIQMSMYESGFDLAVRLKFQIASAFPGPVSFNQGWYGSTLN